MTVETLAEKHVVLEEELIKQLQGFYPVEDLALIKRAYTFAKEHYAQLAHPIDGPYLQHAFDVAKYLAEFGSEPVVVAAALICPPPPTERKVYDELKKGFRGENELLELIEQELNISQLEWGIWPLSQDHGESKERDEILHKMFLQVTDEVKDQIQEPDSLAAAHFQKKEKQIENLIRMFLAEATDIRALIVKLVDRLYTIKGLKDLSPSQQQTINHKQLAKITLAIYAPIADRLGMWPLKSRLEDMSFRLIEPDQYKAIAKELASKKQQREEYIAHIITLVQDQLAGFGIEAKIFGRAKHIYSIYKKMEEQQMSFGQINDLLGIRIIVDTNDNCYNIQSILHEYWQPLTDAYDGKAGRDWIANPKENLYQSLHTTISIEGKAIEVQIRTAAMHKIAEYGVTALRDAVHWRYKESKAHKKARTPREIREKYRSRQLTELRKILNDEQNTDSSMLKDEQEAVISIVKSLLEDRIFVITPEGHVIDLSAGATPLDFAYRIHSDLGHRYTGAKVNGRIVRLDYELKNGEIVELLTSRTRKGPSPEWLAKSKDEDGKRYYLYARTPQARSKIRHWFKEQSEKLKPKA